MDVLAVEHRFNRSDGRVYELNDGEFLELKAMLPDKLRQQVVRQPSEQTYNDLELKRYEWLQSLVRYNELVRVHRSSAGPAHAEARTLTQPQSQEQAEELGYAHASHVLTVFPDRFTDQATLTRFLQKHARVRTYKPSGNRKMVHAGDLIRELASHVEAVLDGLDRESITERAKAIKKKRSQPRK